MSATVTNAFIRQYEREVHHAYQRQGSKIRNTLRTVNGVEGKSTTFQVVGKGTASEKTRHGLIPRMNQDHTAVECTLSDYYAGDYSDRLDELKTNIDERAVIVNGGAWALGRKTDDLIITALDGASNSTEIVGAGETEKGIRNGFLEAIANLGERDVPMDDGMCFGTLSPRAWSYLMTTDEFANADFVGPELPYIPGMSMGGRYMKSWLGVNWVRHSGLTKAANIRTCHIYHYNAVGHAIQQDVQTDISWVGERGAHFIANWMAQGAVLIDDDGVEKITFDESVAFPTT